MLSKEPANEAANRRCKFYTQLAKSYNEINLVPLLCYGSNYSSELSYSPAPNRAKASKLVHYTHTHCDLTEGKKWYYVILSKNEGIASINHNHHKCTWPARKQSFPIPENIKSICRPQQPFLESCDPTTENTDAGALYETGASVLFIANPPHTHYCVILSKADEGSYICGLTAEKIRIGPYYETDISKRYIPNLPHTDRLRLASNTAVNESVSYTHLTLPTIYSV